VTPRVGSERSESVVEREREREREREERETRVKAFRENREETKEMNYFPCV
jgi:hypothetical protein